MPSKLRLRVEPVGTATSLLPVINGLTLIELVGAFEKSCGYTPAGGYAGIVPDHFRFGDLAGYFSGEDNGDRPRPGVVWLLGCDCGDAGCWPLEASVTATDSLVRWNTFRQPHRPRWDYSAFGPFTFDAQMYRTEVQRAINALRGTSRTARPEPRRSDRL